MDSCRKYLLTAITFVVFIIPAELLGQSGTWRASDYFSLMNHIDKRLMRKRICEQERRQYIPPSIADTIFDSDSIDVLLVDTTSDPVIGAFEEYSVCDDTVGVFCMPVTWYKLESLLEKSSRYAKLVERIRAGQYQEIKYNKEFRRLLYEDTNNRDFFTVPPRYSSKMCYFKINNTCKRKQTYDMWIFFYDYEADVILMIRKSIESNQLYRRFNHYRYRRACLLRSKIFDVNSLFFE